MQATFGALIYTHLAPDYLNKAVSKTSKPPIKFKSKPVPRDLKQKFGLKGTNHAFISCTPEDNGSLAVFLTSCLPAIRTGQTLYLNGTNDISDVLG